MKNHRVEIRQYDPGANEEHRHDRGMKTLTQAASHSHSITKFSGSSCGSQPLADKTTFWYTQCIYAKDFRQMKSRISKWGNSLGLRIPKSFGKDLGLTDGSEVTVSVISGQIIITPVSKDYDLDQLVEGITPDNRHLETDWGEPAGAEVW
jgi:antitoxin MazE